MSIRLGISIRNMGPQSVASTMADIAVAADQAGLDSLWVADHIAIPKDESSGSEGRYLDPLATLAWLAGKTERIKLGTGVLVLPYRETLATAKSIASIQELSGNRLLLGVGIGWMKAEFRAVGKSFKNRVTDSVDVLQFLQTCFTSDEVVRHGQHFLFSPQPAKPPIYMGGSAPHAIDRALRYADGWMPMGELSHLAIEIANYKSRSAALGRPDPEVVTFCNVDGFTIADVQKLLESYEAAGVTTLVASRPYADASDWLGTIDILAGAIQ